MLFQLVEEVAVLTERVNNHLEIHSKDDSTTTKATDLRWLKIGIGVAIASPFVTHVLTTIGK